MQIKAQQKEEKMPFIYKGFVVWIPVNPSPLCRRCLYFFLNNEKQSQAICFGRTAEYVACDLFAERTKEETKCKDR